MKADFDQNKELGTSRIQKIQAIQRVAGLFILISIGLIVFTSIKIMLKKGWFESSALFYARTKDAGNIRLGAPVQMSGLKIGAIEAVELDVNGWVRISFSLYKRHLDKVREDSKIFLIRPTVIGERIFDISPGTETASALKPGSVLPIESSEDLLGLLTGRGLGEIFVHLRQVSTELAELIHELNHKKELLKVVRNFHSITNDIHTILPSIASKAPEMSQDITTLISNVTKVTTELARIAPLIADGADRVPAQAAKFIELLNESVTLIKGMERSFLFKSGVSAVKEENAAKQQTDYVMPEKRNRMPASSKP